MSKEQDQAFFRNFSLIVGALAVMMIIFFIAAKISGGMAKSQSTLEESMVDERTAPMGEVSVASEEEAGVAEAPAMADSGGNGGKEVYDGLCVSCHGTGIPGVPQVGDAEAWAPRIAKGTDVLYASAINGMVGSGGMMPARGGNPELSDNDVKAAVDYMVSNSGGSAGASTEVAEESADTASSGIDGKKVYDGLCVNCHGLGPSMAAVFPQVGDTAAWADRIAQGNEVLYDHAINGFTGSMGMMPARGGGLDLTDDEIKAAVDYMVQASQ